MSRPVCLITGATGAIGPSVVTALSGLYDVRTLTRHAPDPRFFPVPVTALTGDICDPSVVRRAADGAAVIVHLAALLHVANPAPSMKAEYERVNVGGTSAVLEAARVVGAGRVVLMSTIAVYGYGSRGLLDEASPTAPTTFYGRTKLDAERLALDARRADGQPLAAVLRAAAVYGPRIKGNYQRLVHALARRRFVPIGPGTNRRTLVHEADLASASVLAARHPRAAGRVFNVTDGEPHPLREIIAAICDALGRRSPRWHAPVGPIRAVLGAASLVNPRFSNLLEKYLEEVAVDGTRLRRELGFAPALGLREGWRTTVEEMRRAGTL
jgi:UDP-glucose 4-epimerase